MKEFVRNILDEDEGFAFGEPWHYEKSLGAILPILQRRRKRRKYLTLQEALADTKDAIEVTETGSIRKVKILNQTDRPVFVRMGTIFQGEGTQSRAVEGSVILAPSKIGEEVEVRCVQASQPIVEGMSFSVLGLSTPRPVEMALYSRSQSEVWDRVSSYAASALEEGAPSSPSQSGSRPGRASKGRQALHDLGSTLLLRRDNLAEVMSEVERFKGEVDEVLKEVPSYEDQVGLVILDKKGVVGLEVFDAPKSWQAVSDDIVKKYGDVLTIGPGEYTVSIVLNEEVILKRTKEFLQEVLDTEGTVTFEEDGHKTYALQGPNLVGEYTTISGGVIHLTGARYTKGEAARTAARSAPAWQRTAPPSSNDAPRS